MPRTFGAGIIHKSHFDALVYEEHDLPESKRTTLSEEERLIGQIIAENLVEDEATLQMGIGAIPDAALAALKQHKDLGIHTEMFSDGALDLIKCGAVTNSKKIVAPGRTMSTFCIGTRDLYRWLNDNPAVYMGDVSFTNNMYQICRNPKVTAINSCIEIDLTGQVVADSIGTKLYSGFGGQLDFIQGAALCERGKPIIALTSQTRKGETKIVPMIKPGAGVVTTRAHVHYVVTEFGIAQLFGKNMRQRAYALIQIAHPDHREALERAGFERMGCMPSPD
jgi:acyl-CoA hydrolase